MVNIFSATVQWRKNPFRSLMRHSLVAFSVLLLVACAVKPNQMPEMQGNAFHVTLYHGYQELAKMEFAEKDYADSRYFSDKSMRAAAGESFSPDEVLSRGLTGIVKISAISMRRKLMAHLNNSAVVVGMPEAAARAQVAFDCWLQEVEEGHQQEDIAACKASFIEHMAELDAWVLAAQQEKMMPTATMDSTATLVSQTSSDSQTTSVMATEAELSLPAPINIYFASNSGDILSSERGTIRSIVAMIKKMKVTSIDLMGHTDRSGGESYNNNLGYQRAEAVYNALREAGMDGVTASLSSMGESDPQVPTADGMAEPLNRRVVVVLQR